MHTPRKWAGSPSPPPPSARLAQRYHGANQARAQVRAVRGLEVVLDVHQPLGAVQRRGGPAGARVQPAVGSRLAQRCLGGRQVLIRLYHRPAVLAGFAGRQRPRTGDTFSEELGHRWHLAAGGRRGGGSARGRQWRRRRPRAGAAGAAAGQGRASHTRGAAPGAEASASAAHTPREQFLDGTPALAASSEVPCRAVGASFALQVCRALIGPGVHCRRAPPLSTSAAALVLSSRCRPPTRLPQP